MKKLFFLFLSFVAVTLFTVSCSKDNQDYAPKAANSSQNASIYDYIGVQHNEGLDYYLKNADFKNKLGEVEPQTLAFGETKGYSREEWARILRDPQVDKIIYSNDPAVAVSDYYKAHGQQQELKYFEQIQQAFSPKATSAAEVVAQLTDIEKAVEADASLEPQSQASLLKGLAIGKHSVEYWYAQAELGEKGPWIIKNTQSGGSPAARINWIKVGLMDLAGGLTGGLVGGLAGSIISIAGQLP